MAALENILSWFKLLLLMLIVSCHSFIWRCQNTVDYLPKCIDSLHLEKQYLDAKWTLYCMYALDTVKKINLNSKHITYGEAALKFDYYDVNDNTIMLGFYFTHYASAKELMYREVIYKLSTKEKIGLGFGHYSIYPVKKVDTIVGHKEWAMLEPSEKRYFYPINNDLISYLKINKDKLDPWFRKEAIIRGVIKE